MKSPPHPAVPPPRATAWAGQRRRAAVERMAAAPLGTVGSTLADTVGTSDRQRLVWLSLLAMPLLVPVALPGMASAVGVLCLLVAWGVGTGCSLPLPRWLGERELSGRVRDLLTRVAVRVIRVIATVGRPRLLALSRPAAGAFNGAMLSAAGLSMVVPVPVISFDNVLPALAMVLLAWGLRLRDGLMLLAGHLVTLLAVVSVGLLWWGGAHLAHQILTWTGLSAGS